MHVVNEPDLMRIGEVIVKLRREFWGFGFEKNEPDGGVPQLLILILKQRKTPTTQTRI